MTRFLSEALQAAEPKFRQSIMHLERAHGHPCNDIRLTSRVVQSSSSKLRDFDLDPNDTSPAELYYALQARIKSDDIRLTRAIRTVAAKHVNATADINDGIYKILVDTFTATKAYGLKLTVLKEMLRTVPPKKAMKLLGYRSIDSMLRHEPAALVLYAALITEQAAWQKRYSEQYKKLSAHDFESRSITIAMPRHERWSGIISTLISEHKNTVFGLRELATIIVLPLPSKSPLGGASLTLTLGLHAVNEILSYSSFLKLSQVRPDFAALVMGVCAGEAAIANGMDGQSVAWQTVHRFTHYNMSKMDHELFDHHIEASDFAWLNVEKVLATIEPSLYVWQSAAHLALKQGNHFVSMNLLDALRNYCNVLPFEHRLQQAFQHSLWHELLSSYLHPAAVERSVMAHLQPQLAQETVMAL